MTTDVSTIQGIYDELAVRIEKMDEKLDSLGDAKGAGKRATVSALMEEYKESWVPFTEQIVEQFSEMDVDLLTAFYHGVTRTLREKFAEPVDKHVEAVVSSRPVAIVEELSPEEIKKLSDERSETYKQAKMLRDLIVSFGGEASALKDLRKRTGARGPRGPRAISLFDWSVNGVPLTGEDNNLTAVAKAHGYEKKAELTAAMKEAGINVSAPEAKLAFTLKDGAVLLGVKRAEEEDDDEEDEDEVSDDEVTETE